MSDEDSDPEAQGIDALRLLKEGSHGLKGGTRSAGVASTSETPGVPLIPLSPSQKRSRSQSEDLGDQSYPGGAQKVQAGNGVSAVRAPSGNISVPNSSQRRDSREREIKQHKSAPEQCLSLAKELRSCKSAPDLTLPALAAIRGLQDGTLQVDRTTRLKIAAAAKRVLEARELKRRSSQEREGQLQQPYPTPDPVSPLALSAQPLWDKPNQGASANDPLQDQRESDGGDGGSQGADIPGSLGTAAAIASGQSPSSGAKANFHRPALGTVSQGGALMSTSHRPFTVTTGLPRFSLGDNVTPNDDNQVAPSIPSTPSRENTPQDRNPRKLPHSAVLSMGDLFAPKGDRR